ncbi:MAG: hypothetical protein OES47_00115 [Acidobacteriota bacterium]|nr:hypothetical protein [Acidobacteriota bacterium]
MTACPDWQRIARSADRFLAEDCADRRRTLRHMEACPSCRRSALELDPTLAVANLPAVEVSKSEIEAVKRQVQAMRRVRAIEVGKRRPVLSHVAVVMLMVGLGLFLPGRVIDPAGSVAQGGVGGGVLFDEASREAASSLALVESITPSTARIYQLDQADFPIVMIVDESIDL